MTDLKEIGSCLDAAMGLVAEMRQAIETPGFVDKHPEFMDYTTELIERALTRLERDFANEQTRTEEALSNLGEGA